MQGLVQRADPRKTLNSVPLGVVPCGSGNGLAKSVLRDAGEAYGIAPAAFVVLKGKPLPLDINMYESATQRYVEGKGREEKGREEKREEKGREEKGREEKSEENRREEESCAALYDVVCLWAICGVRCMACACAVCMMPRTLIQV